MYFELFLGLKYLKAKRKQVFVSVITVISVLGVTVGVMALVVVLSVMNGFRTDLMNKILGVNSHLLVLSRDGVMEPYLDAAETCRRTDGVVAVTPFIHSQVMINNAGNVSGAVLRGINPATAGAVVGIDRMVTHGTLGDLSARDHGVPTVVLGSELARQTGAYPGGTVTIVSPEGRVTPLGRVPNSRSFKVAGLFDSGMYEYDASMAFIGLAEAKDFLGLGRSVTGLEVRVTDPDESDDVGRELERRLGESFRTKDWKLMNKSLFSALKLEKFAMFVILTMIVLVGALNIISTLVMVVMEKSRDIAVLRALGASAASVMSVFMIQGVLVGVVGTVTGLCAGLGICHVISAYDFVRLPADVYYISTLPVRVESLDVFWVAVAAVGISFCATIYPSWYAASLNPVETIRYE